MLALTHMQLLISLFLSSFKTDNGLYLWVRGIVEIFWLEFNHKSFSKSLQFNIKLGIVFDGDFIKKWLDIYTDSDSHWLKLSTTSYFMQIRLKLIKIMNKN